jgi:cyclopropane fatty-acyl-phospholipid synthase-like methyltransferase
MSTEIVRHHRREFLPAAGHDLFLPLYDPLVSLLGGDRARQELINQARIENGQSVLDIGCGTGTLVMLLKKQYPTVDVAGLDPDSKALRRAKNKARRAAVSLQLDQGFADELPYRDGSFDRVLSSFMFHHLEEHDRENMLREALRVLKSAGSLHLLDFAGGDHGSHGLLGHLINSSHRLKDNSEERILQLMRRAGFTHARKIKDSSMFFGALKTSYFEART